ncbi:tRNA 2-thiouridine(34) synthase MnmA [Thermosynechococcaceae cyanobacterium BACA0444]|uniref:tRNA-specific 2-thiouridylase MnmA n=1 Tax=Pseudocalidococcus azoricus BACA0444 TaxID=2918990 RepID=A0AAE4FPP8_9CYAN|nr:tRNA 2-thiouridine(34) synthase MnmA [Pseudocalidococcus azoricus]MDS3859998.1 tRNA 2-thiouridine(34) synthase MnmA [Pseudocalidococcus azoricus BACA0444]
MSPLPATLASSSRPALDLTTPIVVGLSGGVDSSVAIASLHQQGYPVIGVTLWLMKGKGQCCSEGMVDAARLCEELGVPYQVVDSREVFQTQIIDYLVAGYSAGITPLPCSQCNRMVKFGPLLAYAQASLGANHIATGHYARIRYNSTTERYELWRAVDRKKDQSYFLYDLTQDHLAHTLFPLGEQTKAETRAMASQFNLHTASKPESQDLCLVEAHGSMREFLAQYIPPQSGEIVDQSGQVLGYHEGIHNYTIGQRKGIGIAAAEPLYVLALDTTRNQVIVGPRTQAEQGECNVQRLNWVSIPPVDHPLDVTVQIRYQSQPTPATLIPDPDNPITQAKLVFAEPQFGVTPGQAAVWYDGERLLGGGIIE